MIYVDDREPHALVDKLVYLGVPHEVQRLVVGDFLWWDADEEPVVVTRKAGDAIASIFSGHFQEELDGIGEFVRVFANPHVVFLIEGPWASTGPQESAHFKRSGEWFRKSNEHKAPIKVFMGLQAAMVAANIPVVQTTSHLETATMLERLYQRSMDGWPSNITRGLKKPNLRWSWQEDKATRKVQRLMALWPRLSEPVAMRLLDTYGSIAKAIEAAHNNPESVRGNVTGIGPKLIENLMEVLE